MNARHSKPARRRSAWAAAAVLAALALGAGPVHAAAPIATEVIDVDIHREDPGFAAACGLETVLVHERVRGFVRFYEGGLVRDHVVGRITFSNPDGGSWVRMSFARSGEFGPPVSVSVDGALMTLTFHEAAVGLTERWHGPGIGVVALDAGQIVRVVEVVLDTSVDPEVDDPVVSFTVSILTASGPHPIAENGFTLPPAALAVLCAALAG